MGSRYILDTKHLPDKHPETVSYSPVFSLFVCLFVDVVLIFPKSKLLNVREFRLVYTCQHFFFSVTLKKASPALTR